MFKSLQILVASLPLTALPAVTARAGETTGIVSVGPAVFCFTLAGALLLTLVFRRAAAHFAAYVSRRLGEFRLRRALARRGPDTLHDLLLPGAYGGLARIDHAILTAGGILCIRSCHTNGMVFADADEPQWTVVDGPERRRFLNPLIQNEGRVRALGKVVADAPVGNLVVFTGRVEFSGTPPANVIHVSRVDSYIAKYVFGPSKIKDWDAVWLTLRSAALTGSAGHADFATRLGYS